MSIGKEKDPKLVELESIELKLRGREKDKREVILKYFLRGISSLFTFVESHPKDCENLGKDEPKKDEDDNEEGPKSDKFEGFIRRQGGEELDYESLMVSFRPLSAFYDLKKIAKEEGKPFSYLSYANLLLFLIKEFPALRSSSNTLVSFKQLISDYILNIPTTSALEFFLEAERSYKPGVYPTLKEIEREAVSGFDLFLALTQGKKQKHLEKEMTMLSVIGNPWNQGDEAGIISAKTFAKLFSNYKPGELFVSSRDGLQSDTRLAGIKDKALKAIALTKNKVLISELAGLVLQLGIARGSIEDLLCVLEICETQKPEVSWTEIIHRLAEWIKYQGMEDFLIGNYKKESAQKDFHHCRYTASNGNLFICKNGNWVSLPSNTNISSKDYKDSPVFCLQGNAYVFSDVMPLIFLFF